MADTVETWRPITWSLGASVSSTGQVWSAERGVHPIRDNGEGYLRTRVRYPEGLKSKYLHRLIAEAFIPNPENLPFVLHWDDNPGNNRVENLRWGTKRDNEQDKVRNGNNPNARKTHCKRGHEFNESNTRRVVEGRQCRECKRVRDREYKAASRGRARGNEERFKGLAEEQKSDITNK